MDANYVIYSTSLSYKPSASRNSPIVRTNSATVSIQCYYPRHGNVSSDAIKPTWLPFSSTVSSEEKLSFSLRLMTEDWSQTRDSIFFSLGDSFHIEASVDVQNHLPMRVSVDSCRAVTSDDPNSTPQYDLIAYNGCLVDSKLEDSASTFVSRPQPNRLQFLIDSFQFIGALDYTVYIFCTLKAVPLTQAPDPTNKACSFSKSSNTWSAVEGAANICSCCDSGNCDVTSQARRLRPGSRRQWKRDNEAVEQSEQEVQVKALGPLILMAPPQNTEALAVQTDSREQEVKPWMAAAVGSLWLVVAIAAVLTWKLRAKSHVTNLQ
ncbi:zona pellucida sperm-binding protein 3-like isoform X2 [Hyperolius riggenbachi]